jgi:hypothetical protein
MMTRSFSSAADAYVLLHRDVEETILGKLDGTKAGLATVLAINLCDSIVVNRR